MTPPSLVIEVSGRPAPQGSKRHVGGGRMVESSAAVGPWRDAVRAAAVGVLSRGPDWPLAAWPTSAYIVYTLARPRGHYRTGRNAHLLRDDAPTAPARRPDLDKLIRSTLDALVDASALADDAQVIHVDATKTYPGGHLDALDAPGALIILTAPT